MLSKDDRVTLKQVVMLSRQHDARWLDISPEIANACLVDMIPPDNFRLSAEVVA